MKCDLVVIESILKIKELGHEHILIVGSMYCLNVRLRVFSFALFYLFLDSLIISIK